MPFGALAKSQKLRDSKADALHHVGAAVGASPINFIKYPAHLLEIIRQRLSQAPVLGKGDDSDAGRLRIQLGQQTARSDDLCAKN